MPPTKCGATLNVVSGVKIAISVHGVKVLYFKILGVNGGGLFDKSLYLSSYFKTPKVISHRTSPLNILGKNCLHSQNHLHQFYIACHVRDFI